MTRFRLLLIASLFGCVQPGRADTDLQTKGAASLEVRCDGEKKSLALADTITVTLKIEGSPALRVQAPLDLPAGASWILVERSKAERMPLGTASACVGNCAIGSRPREHREEGSVRISRSSNCATKEDEDRTVSRMKPIFQREVVTSIAPTDRAQLRDITAIEKLPQPPVVEPGSRMWLVVAASSLLFGLTLLGFVIPVAVAPPCGKSPHSCALYELASARRFETPRARP